MTPLTLQYIVFEAESRTVKALLSKEKKEDFRFEKKVSTQSDIYYRKIFQGTLLERAEFNGLWWVFSNTREKYRLNVLVRNKT